MREDGQRKRGLEGGQGEGREDRAGLLQMHEGFVLWQLTAAATQGSLGSSQTGPLPYYLGVPWLQGMPMA